EAWLMPHDPDFIALLESWRVGPAAAIDPELFWIIATALYYAPDHEFPAQERLEDIVRSVRVWRWKDGGSPFRPQDLPQLVFAYALSIQRPAGGLTGETVRQAAAWGERRWGHAVRALELALRDLA